MSYSKTQFTVLPQNAFQATRDVLRYQIKQEKNTHQFFGYYDKKNKILHYCDNKGEHFELDSFLLKRSLSAQTTEKQLTHASFLHLLEKKELPLTSFNVIFGSLLAVFLSCFILLPLIYLTPIVTVLGSFFITCIFITQVGALFINLLSVNVLMSETSSQFARTGFAISGALICATLGSLLTSVSILFPIVGVVIGLLGYGVVAYSDWKTKEGVSSSVQDQDLEQLFYQEDMYYLRLQFTLEKKTADQSTLSFKHAAAIKKLPLQRYPNIYFKRPITIDLLSNTNTFEVDYYCPCYHLTEDEIINVVNQVSSQEWSGNNYKQNTLVPEFKTRIQERIQEKRSVEEEFASNTL